MVLKFFWLKLRLFLLFTLAFCVIYHDRKCMSREGCFEKMEILFFAFRNTVGVYGIFRLFWNESCFLTLSFARILLIFTTPSALQGLQFSWDLKVRFGLVSFVFCLLSERKKLSWLGLLSLHLLRDSQFGVLLHILFSSSVLFARIIDLYSCIG